MNISIYNMIYIISNIFGTYIICKFMSVFFERKEANKKLELFSYTVYYIVMTIIYFKINIPIVTMLFNIIAFMGLSMLYKANIKKRILAIALIYLILICIELIVIMLLSGMHFTIFSKNEYTLSYSLIVLKIVSYLVVLILNKYKNIKMGERVPFSYWVCLLLIPLSSLYIILILFQAQGLLIEQVILGIVFILLINFATFHLYDAISSTLSDKMHKKLIAQQNMYYDTQFNLMKSSLKATKIFKHDLMNHLSVIYTLVANEEKEASIKHICNMIEVCNDENKFADSGNINIDSILNFKLQESKQKNIPIFLDLYIPEKMDIPSFDLAVILGNLLDNAIKAVSELEEERYININIKYDKGRFIVNVENPFCGKLLKDGNEYLTTKKNKHNHGIGLDSIKIVLQKYDGFMEIKHIENIFFVTVLMFI
ncbi:GHKL domain-containing protein [Alkalibaculum sp. M08DMB]|uniref:GHKL domain-containing protein n=1 Tax=Alkalibaculum sporogenes TaxID=2655001 RepID=A0A6A7KBI9_9FIRM|nr:sensor histidine kinase [Alkalibaculum sporogenes]MPW26373.1 GHKL domain-containing protein [Alkalibaculum sporogenes]